MADRVELAFRRSADRLIRGRGAILAAVSGGGDSVALLHLLDRFARRLSVPVTVAHLDHALRRGSGADRRFVERLARELGRTCISDRRDVRALRRKCESPEEAARRVRRGFLLESARASDCACIATGHTLDDQAETILMRLLRGAGPTALTGMAESGPGPFVRPLLDLERSDLRAYLDRRGAPFRDDPSNRDLRFDRNRVRRLVIPFLADALNPRAARHLVQAGRRLREDSEHLDHMAEVALEELSRHDRAGGVALDALRLADLAPPVGRRLVRLALERAGADPRRIHTRHVEALIELARGGNGRSAHLPTGVSARRRGKLLWLGKN